MGEEQKLWKQEQLEGCRSQMDIHWTGRGKVLSAPGLKTWNRSVGVRMLRLARCKM